MIRIRKGSPAYMLLFAVVYPMAVLACVAATPAAAWWFTRDWCKKSTRW